MKIIESEEENNENRKGELSEDALGDEDVTMEVDQDRVPAVTPRGRGRPRKNTLMSDSVSPLAKVSATPSRGRGRPPKHTSIIKSPLEKDSSLPSERKGRGRPKKIVVASDIVGTLEKTDETQNVDVIGLEEKDSPLPSERRGRGRPKKIVDASDIVGTLEKTDETQNVDVIGLEEKDSPLPLERRGRGRPKKIIGASDVIGTLEKPTQNVDLTDLKQKADSIPRRGRGRPKKNFGNFSASTSLIAANSTPRRGRGRSRKSFKNIGRTPLSKGRVGRQNNFKRFGAIKLLAQALAKHGRGRPRKGTGIKDAVQILQKDPVLSQPKRGRPPKSIKRMFAMKLLAKAMAIGCQDEAVKSVSITDVTKALKASRRGRGRPRKVVDVTTGATSEKASAVAAVTPRGRGRPRKNLETPGSTLQLDKAPAVTPTTPRGRGRPRKNLPTAGAAVLSASKVTEAVAEISKNVEIISDVSPPKSPVIHTLVAP